MSNVIKQETVVAVAASPTSTRTSEDGSTELPRRYRWRPTFWRVRPLLGVLALLTTILCLLVSLAVLKASHGDQTSKWTFQPTAIATAISNAALQCALAEAAPVSWWYKALQGSTVKDLELDWEAGQSFPRAFLKSYKYRRMVSLFSIASFATAIVLIDGPLLQKSSSVRRATNVDELPLNISLAPQLPSGFSVQITNEAYWEWTPAAVDAYQAHISQTPMTSDAYCNGTCRTTVRAPGFTSVRCHEQIWPINETMVRDPNSTWGIGPQGGLGSSDGMAEQPVIYSVATPSWGGCIAGREPMLVSTGRANYHGCKGNFTFTNCTMMPAALEYNITIRDNVITYDPPPFRSRFATVADNYCSNSSVSATTGFISLMYPYIFSNGTLGRHTDPPAGIPPLEVPNTASFSAFAWRHLESATNTDVCTLTTRDPMQEIVSQYNDILFRSGLIAGSWVNITRLLDISPSSVHQAVQAIRTREENVYHSDMRWFLGAASVQICTMFLILPAYYGWWKIGVELTLSPFHTAKAFDAPVLKGVNSAAGSAGIVHEQGEMHLKLGAVDAPIVEQNLTNGEMKQRIVHRSRIGIDVPDRVVEPLKNGRFID